MAEAEKQKDLLLQQQLAQQPQGPPAQGLLAKSLQEDDEDDILMEKARFAVQPMADDDSDMQDITKEKYSSPGQYEGMSDSPVC